MAGSLKTLSVGLILKDKASAAVRKALAKRRFRIAFEISHEEIENGHPSKEIDVIVLTGPLRSSGEALVRRVRRRYPEKPLVACIRPADASRARWAIANGADGVVLETRLEETLEPTLHAVHAGQVVIPRDPRRRAPSEELTNREKQSLSLVIMGLSNREIAEKLYLSESTVKSHLNTAFRKLGVRSRAEAARLITDPDGGLGTGILAITAPGLARGRRPKS